MTENTALVVRFIDECWNKRSRTICRQLLALHYEHYMPGSELPTIGPDAYQELVDTFTAAFPDIRFDIEDAFGEGEKVCVVWTAYATHLGAFGGFEATKKPVVIKGVAVGRVLDGSIVRIISMFDNAGFAQQLDVRPEDAVQSWTS